MVNLNVFFRLIVIEKGYNKGKDILAEYYLHNIYLTCNLYRLSQANIYMFTYSHQCIKYSKLKLYINKFYQI